MTRRHRKRRSMGKYDPAPRTRRKRSVPPQLRAWVFGRRARRTHDPGYMRTMHRGPKGGTYFAGPKKRRYDPQPRFRRARAYLARHPRYARVGSKLEGGLNRWGMLIGAALGLIAGIWQGYNEEPQNYLAKITGGPIKDSNGNVVAQAVPEISHLWSLDPAKDAYYLPNYLKYKFLGIDPVSNQYVGSAWVIPFWAGIAAFIASKLPLGQKFHRYQRPIGKIGLSVAAVSAVGALALPGSPMNNSGYGNIPSASAGYNQPMRLSGPAPSDGSYHNI